MTSNIYDRLPAGTRTIRLVELLPGKRSDIVECTLHEGPLGTDQPYKALSYAWNDHKATSKVFIICNKKKLEVSLNLYHALRQLRHFSSPVILWVDALCINQADDAERTHQVGMMREIYENSYEIAIWLGELRRLNAFGEFVNATEEESENNVQLEKEPIEWHDDEQDLPKVNAYLRAFARAEPNLVSLDDKDEVADVFGAFCLIRLLSQGTLSEDIAFFRHIYWGGDVIKALWAIMKLPWWTRTWVVQETVVAQRSTLYYSNISAPWTMFSKAATNYVQSRILENLDLYGSQETRDPLAHFSRTVLDIESTRIDWMNLEPITILSLLRKFRSREASDERDKVFALLGLVKHWEHGAPIFPDYSLAPEELFWRTTINIISSTRSLSVLVGTLYSSKAQPIPKTSWVTNWGVPPQQNEYERLSRLNMYNASCRLEGAVRLHGNRVLEVQGLFVDEIVTVGSELPHGQVNRLRAVISEWSRLAYPQTDTKGRKEVGRRNAFWRTICANTLYSDTGTGGYQKADASGENAFLAWMLGGDVLAARRTTCIIDGQWQDYAEPPEVNKSKNSFHYSVESASSSRVFFLTRRGYMGTGPSTSQKGDHIYVFLGSRVPFVLSPGKKPRTCRSERLRVLISDPKGKKLDSTCSQVHTECCSLIGDAYVHGYMEGKAIKDALKRSIEPRSVYLV